MTGERVYWIAGEVDTLKFLFQRGVPDEEIAKVLGREGE
jgi:hypothetical protein